MISTLAIAFALFHSQNLVQNSDFGKSDQSSKSPANYQLSGNAKWSWVGYADETPVLGVRFNASEQPKAGSVSQVVTNIDYTKGHWIKFSVRGRAEDGFSVANDKLFLKVDFLSRNGTHYLETAQRLIYREVLKDRRDFTANGNFGKAGAAVWRTYAFEELLPFKEVDAVKLTLGFENGNSAIGKEASFCVTDFSLFQSDQASDGRKEPAAKDIERLPQQEAKQMVHLGGRWYYRPTPNETVAVTSNGKINGKLTINADNADRLFYLDEQLTNPFRENMSAWLRKGYKDRSGNVVQSDQYVKDNVTITFDGSDFWTVHAKNLPNHQTAKFPDTYGTQGYNPSYIQEHDYAYRFPLEPKPNKNAIAMTDRDSNGALNMGTVGIAVNGVAFYNPFDAGMQDASSIMDRCCGHPSPDNRYHYHKYPICVNTPFVDKGNMHSPLIGFALDGMPLYGPYEAADLMAKDSKDHPLNAFNAHWDKVRGWHYHVTPGKFPYIIGGYFARWW